MSNIGKHYCFVLFLLVSLLISAAHVTFDHYDFSDNGIAQFLGEDCNDCTFSHSATAVDTSGYFFTLDTHQDALKHPDVSPFVVTITYSYLVRAPPVFI